MLRLCLLKEAPNSAGLEGLFFFEFFPSLSATNAILAESTSWKELGSDMYDMELQHKLAFFLVWLCCTEGCSMCSGLVGLWRIHQAYLYCACTRDFSVFLFFAIDVCQKCSEHHREWKTVDNRSAAG